MAVSGASTSGSSVASAASAVQTSTAPTTQTATTAASAVTTNSIDVASIVSQLMQVENQPMVALQAKVAGVQTTISDLGSMKSKVVALESALTTFEDPSTYNNPTASSSDSTVVTATASSNAAIGSVAVSVSQLATATQLLLTKGASANFNSATDTVPIDSNLGLSITVGGKTYNTKDQSNPLVPTGLHGAATLTDLKNWINGLGANVSANIIQTVSSNDYVLQINGTETGAANAVSVGVGPLSSATTSTLLGLTGGVTGTTYTPTSVSTTGVGTGATFSVNLSSDSAGTVTMTGGTGYRVGDSITIAAGQLGANSSAATFKITSIEGSGNQLSASTITSAQDAIATIGGVTVNRSSNSISDVINGMTFNLVGQSAGGNTTSITVQQGADNSSAMINTLITAYNDVVNQYNTYTANSNSGTSTTSTNGDFANDPTILSFVNNIKSMFANGATDTTKASVSGYSSLSDNALIDTKNGYLQVNGAKYNFSSISNTTPTVGQFITWVNGLNAGVTASFDGTNIQLSNSQTGGTNSIDLSGVNNPINRTTVSLASMGMDIQLDGTIQFNTATYQQAASSGLYSQLAKGLKMGFAGGGSSLDAFLTSEVDPSNGALVQQISTQQTSISDLQKKESDLQEHLNVIQNSYITQYSALNALLFQLNSTSTSLASSLTAITNINAGK